MASLPDVPVSLTASSPASPSSRNPAKLSPAKIAGIAVSSILVIAFVGLSLLFRDHRRRKSNEHKEAWSKTELHANDVDNEARGLGPHMAESKPLVEAEDVSYLPEIECRTTAHEAEGQRAEVFEAPADLSVFPEISAEKEND